MARVDYSAWASSVRKLQDADYRETAGKTIKAINASVKDSRLRKLLKDWEEAGIPNDHRFEAVIQRFETVMQTNARRIDSAAPAIENKAFRLSDNVSKRGASYGMPSEARAVINQEWSSSTPEVLANITRFTDNPAWKDYVKQYTTDGVDQVRNVAIRGMAQSASPTTVAREVSELMESIPRYRANEMMRTLYLESYRRGEAVMQTENRHLISRVIRAEVLDGRICPACVALHGTVVWDSKRDANSPVGHIDEHHQGRGFTISEVNGYPREVESGTSWLRNQSLEMQQKILPSADAVTAFRANRLPLSNFVSHSQDPVFGRMLEVRSAESALAR